MDKLDINNLNIFEFTSTFVLAKVEQSRSTRQLFKMSLAYLIKFEKLRQVPFGKVIFQKFYCLPLFLKTDCRFIKNFNFQISNWSE